MTDAEFWGVLAEMIEGAGCLPETALGHPYDGENCRGLCECLLSATNLGIISDRQCERLYRQLEKKYNKVRTGFFWELFATKPRIAACRALMRACLEREL